MRFFYLAVSALLYSDQRAMKTAFLLLFLTFVGCSFCQQNPFVREGSIGEVRKEVPTRIGPGTLEVAAWPGQNFILLPQSSDTPGYFLHFEPRLSYREWVGKILVVSKVDNEPTGGQSFRKVYFRSEDGKSVAADLIFMSSGTQIRRKFCM